MKELKLTNPEVIFESEDSYEFKEAAEALRKGDISFEAVEEYTGIHHGSRRAPPPYIWRIFVSRSEYETAKEILSSKKLLQCPPEVIESANATTSKNMKFYYRFLLAVIIVSTIYGLYQLLKNN